MSAILHESPPDLKTVRADVPQELGRILERCLRKDRESRYASAADLWRHLAGLHTQLAARQVGLRALVREPRVVIAAALLVVLLLAGGTWLYVQSARARWVRNEALPEVARLIDENKIAHAFRLVRRAERYLPLEPELQRFRQNHVKPFSIRTEPAEAEIHIRDYVETDDSAEWESLGRSPLESIEIPRGFFRCKISKAGYEPLERTFGAVSPESLAMQFRLIRSSDAVPGMVFVTGGSSTRWFVAPHGPIHDFWLDKYEVTNRRFKQFVDAGGYSKREYWKHPFVKDGRTLSWAEAMATFRDTTGRPGPSTWEFGIYSEGQEDFPVHGVSWYEAEAYAEFAGKRLPTVYHWSRAVGFTGPEVLGLSNFSGRAPALITDLAHSAPMTCSAT